MSLFNSIFPGLKMQSSDFKGQVYPLGEVEVPGIIPKGNENQQRCEGTHGLGIWEGWLRSPGASWPHSLTSCHQAAPSSHCPAICSHCLFRKNEFWNPHHSPLCGHTVPCNVLTLRLFTHSCLTLCDPVDCSLPGSSAQGVLQARRLEWVAMPSSRGSSQPRIKPRSSTLRVIPYHLHHQGIKKTLKSFYSILVDHVSFIHLFHCVLRPSSLIAAMMLLFPVSCIAVPWTSSSFISSCINKFSVFNKAKLW